MKRDFLLGGAALLFLTCLTHYSTQWFKRAEREIPEVSDNKGGAVAVELVVKKEIKGIYFVTPGENISAFLGKQALVSETQDKTEIQQGMLIQYTDQDKIMVGQMAPHEKVALGMVLDLNVLSKEEIMLMPGIGEQTAEKIQQFIKARGCIDALSELTEIPGIKEKKITRMKQYFSVNPTLCDHKRFDTKGI